MDAGGLGSIHGTTWPPNTSRSERREEREGGRERERDTLRTILGIALEQNKFVLIYVTKAYANKGQQENGCR